VPFEPLRAYEAVPLLPVDNEGPGAFAKDRFRLSGVGPVVRLTLCDGLPWPDPYA
jgi:hypothetical protein